MTRRSHLTIQAALAIGCLASIGIFRAVTPDWILYGAYVPGVLAIVAPLASAWDRRIHWTTAIGAPATMVLLVAVSHCAFAMIGFARNNRCDELPHACEGYSIFLFLYPIYAAILILSAMILGAITRFVAWLWVSVAARTNTTRFHRNRPTR